MCNNLLQYAHVYAWGREHGRKVISMRFSYKYQYFRICHTELTGFGWYLFAKYMAALHLLPTASFKYAECDREALERKMLRHRHIVVSGWNVRFYDLFLKYRSEICDLFTLDARYTEPVKQQMCDVKGLRLGVHVRRGDYAQWKDGIYCYDDDVYAATSTVLPPCTMERRCMSTCLRMTPVSPLRNIRPSVLVSAYTICRAMPLRIFICCQRATIS